MAKSLEKTKKNQIQKSSVVADKHKRVMHFKIYRFDPAKDKKPYMKSYKLDTSKIQGKMLLNALEAIKEQDPTLALRRSCGEGVCGSDGMNINGTNGLACITPLANLPNDVILQPLPGFPVIRDLIVDMNAFYAHYYSVDPYLQNHVEPPAKERLQSPEQRSKLDGLYECILCACCTSSCPSYWWNPDKFVGPAGLLTSYRFVVDSRDTMSRERLEKLADPYSAMRCRTIMNCATVCPKNLSPSSAIQKLRSNMLKDMV